MSRWNSQAALDDALARAEASVADAAQISAADRFRVILRIDANGHDQVVIAYAEP